MHEIKTERLTMRDAVPGDLDGYMAFVSDYEVIKWTASWPYPADREFTLSRCRQVPSEQGFVGPVFLGDEQIGGMGCMDGELGYFFAQDHWGKGYATEIARAVIARAFAVMDWDQITAGVFDGNPGSIRVLDKLGFKETGRGKLFSKAQGKELHGPDFVLTRSGWLAANPLCIETDRLIIRVFSADDTAAFHGFASRNEVARMMQSIQHPLSREQAQDWIDGRIYDGQLGFCPGVYLKDGTLIGAAGIGGDPVNVAYFFDPSHWGQGYATEAVHAFLTVMFKQFDLTEIEAGAMEDNPASQRVLTKLGFTEIGRKMHQPSLRLEPDPLILYRLTRTQFEAAL